MNQWKLKKNVMKCKPTSTGALGNPQLKIYYKASPIHKHNYAAGSVLTCIQMMGPHPNSVYHTRSAQALSAASAPSWKS
jgi:hypothetical protein